MSGKHWLVLVRLLIGLVRVTARDPVGNEICRDNQAREPVRSAERHDEAGTVDGEACCGLHEERTAV